MRRFMTFLTGAFCGALVGAVTALLLAPSSGDEFKARIQQRKDEFRQEIQEAYETRMAQLEGELDMMRGRLKQREE
jgi:gas vesicle protein